MNSTSELPEMPVPRPMASAPKDHTWVRLLVDYSQAGLDGRPMEDSASPSWTIGSNGEDHTGVPGWTFVGWNWSQDCIVETTAGVPIGWLPFHGIDLVESGFTLVSGEVASRVLQRILDFDDRTSPEDQPDMLLVTGKELAGLIEEECASAFPAPSPALRDIAIERQRQIEGEGWTPQHDDEHSDGSLALAAACYAEGPSGRSRVESVTDDVSGGRGETPVWGKRKVLVPRMWPRSWCASWWKPSEDRRRDLVKAGALIVAEIERIDRAAARSELAA